MTPTVVQVLGTNGAGKSTLFRTLAQSDDAAIAATVLETSATLVPRYQGVLIGNYLADKKTPGVDGIHGKEATLDALSQTLAHVHSGLARWVGWEGIIIMTQQYHQEILKRDARALYLVLDTPEDVCFARIEGRSGKTRADLKQNGKIVVNRRAGMLRLATWLATQPDAEVVYLDGQATPHIWITQLMACLKLHVERRAV